MPTQLPTRLGHDLRRTVPWTKDSASSELNELIDAIDGLRAEKRFGAAHSRWLLRARTLLLDVFGPKSVCFGSFARLSWSFTGVLEDFGQGVLEEAHQRTYVERLETARGFLLAARDEREAGGGSLA